MRTTAIGLLIWLVIMLSERVNCMEHPSVSGKGDAQPVATPTPSADDQKPALFPNLYSEDAIKKAWRQGYRSAMRDSNQTIAALDAQRQQVHMYNLEMQEKVTLARDQLDKLLISTPLKSPQFAQLQAIWTLLNQACEPPKK